MRVAAVGIPREASDMLGTGERYGVEPPIRYYQRLLARDKVDEATARRGAATLAILLLAACPGLTLLATSRTPLTG
mgnify:CR=1 FL=1